jgi:putative tricarboxylic transport membrane protein
MVVVKKEEKIASFVWALFSIAYIMGAFAIPVPSYKQQLGPDAFPKAVGFLMLLLSLIYMIQVFTGKRNDDEARAEIIGAEEKLEKKADLKKMGSIVLVMLCYAALFEPLGYAISTFLAFLAGILILDRKKIVRDIVIAVIASFGLHFLFTLFLRVNLPAGPLKLLGL